MAYRIKTLAESISKPSASLVTESIGLGNDIEDMPESYKKIFDKLMKEQGLSDVLGELNTDTPPINKKVVLYFHRELAGETSENGHKEGGDIYHLGWSTQAHAKRLVKKYGGWKMRVGGFGFGGSENGGIGYLIGSEIKTITAADLGDNSELIADLKDKVKSKGSDVLKYPMIYMDELAGSDPEIKKIINGYNTEVAEQEKNVANKYLEKLESYLDNL